MLAALPFSLHRGEHVVFVIVCIPRDAQRDDNKRAEKPKVYVGGEQVILCHTDGVLREWLPPLRGWGALDTRSAVAERAGNQNDRSAYEYGRPFLREYSDLYGANPFRACVV
jgi:hypothetical protein